MICSIVTSRKNETFASKHLLSKLKGMPEFHAIFSAKFHLLSQKKQEELYNNFSVLKEYGITLNDVRAIAEDLHYLQAEIIFAEMKAIVDYIIESQNSKSGAWHIISEEELLNFEGIVYGTYGAKIQDWTTSHKTSLIPNAWANALMILILMKWLGIINESLIDKKYINKVEKAIFLGKKWFDENKNKSPNIMGWGPFVPGISDDLVNTYDTSLVYISLSYDSRYSPLFIDKNTNELIHIPDILLSPEIRNNESGAWYTDNTQSRKEDVGATSYAIVLLLKLYEHTKKGKEEIEQGIQWLCNQQNNDDGWGEYHDTPSTVDKTCLAIMTLLRYEKWSNNIFVTKRIKNGLTFIEHKLTPYDCTNDEGQSFQIECWPKRTLDNSQDPCFRNSSLAISTLLKCGHPIYSYSVRNSVTGLIRLYKAKRKVMQCKPIDKLDEGYFLCMLADYLKAWIHF
ncbi:MAG: hypothetical protein HZB61_05450 [Nitrospirae bacterium]|nr:hypothetical protein [Nitrospirota bacterium]